ncbi:hypothetical protein Acr_25g0009500 [Actinidia rufa]|uniref:Bulb-type lectin domain-containing protein n=1 Tax=Actinidia rufa TaxID=165716 RepID=A0A7J0H0I9_9ERIC|nr:hypothetical protein Acr_25g0009500 [Actinidia rufa]
MAYPDISNLLFLSLLPFLPVFAASNINLSSSLSATGGDDSWISPSGEFAFGFCKINNTNTFLLAIWYAKIPKQTIVWHANTSSPVQTGSKVNLTPNGLALNDPSGQTIWKAQPNTAVSYGAMLDTGNFVLSGTNNSFYVWESFDYPTDTILPTQVLSLGGMLYSKLSEANYSKGRFELHFTNGGDLELVPIAWPSEIRYQHYYTSATANPDASQSGFQLVFSQSADINIVIRNGTTIPLSRVSITPNLNNYHRATLDSDGVFRQYTCPNTSIGDQSWSVVRYIPDNICAALRNEFGSGVCGFNSYCLENSGTVDCQCPHGYSFLDPNDKFGGCKPNFPQGCGVDDGTRNPNELYDLVQMVNVNFPFGDYDSLGPYNQMQCEQSCLHDCSCAVVIFSGTRCWKKRLPLSNGRREEGALAIIKLRVRQHSTANPDFSDGFLKASEEINKSVAQELGEEEGAILTDWAYDCYTEGRLDALVDNEEAAMMDIATLQRWVMTAIWCIQEDPSKRPTMKRVMQMLEGCVEVPIPI